MSSNQQQPSQPPANPPSQAAYAGKNAIQVGRDYKSTVNFNIVFFLIGVLAFGGLAWGFYAGWIKNPSFNPSHPQPGSVAPSPGASP